MSLSGTSLQRFRHRLLFLLSVVWASPYSCLGLLIGLLGCLSGGGMRRRGCALEFHGGLVNRFLGACGSWVSAMTLGHTILGQNERLLDACRDHEWVHVRQYQRWGPFFGPAYVICSIMAWLQGKRPYRDNYFEREAYGDKEPLR